MSAGLQENEEFVPSGQLRAELGGISDMTLWRWLKDPKLNFPQPVQIRNRRYWRRSEINGWKVARSQKREAV
jgi:predicted DNA-binding transcriptional regulator AlpA